MHKRVTFRGLEHSPVIEQYITKELEKIERFIAHIREPIYMDFVLDAERDFHHYRAELRLKLPFHDLLVAHYEDVDVYKAIDRVIEKMNGEVHKAKEKLIDSTQHGDHFKGA